MVGTCHCRACNRSIERQVLLSFEDSPLSAQGFSDSSLNKTESVTLDIIACPFCGVVQHDLPPVDYYKDVIRAVAYSREMADYRQGQLSEWITLHSLHEKCIIEIGSGRGEYLKLLKDCGAKNVYGIENSPKSLLQATSSGYQVQQGYLDLTFKNPWHFNFDGFAIFSFIEHWPGPQESFAALHRILSDGAIGIVEVPNFELILTKGLFTEFTPDHIFYFDVTSFTLFLESNGFDVLSVDPIWHDYILSAQVRKRKSIEVSHFLEVKKKLADQLNKFLSESHGDKVIWGAGHQALAVISMTGIFSQLDYIVDSAIFKQGKYTPASNLLINSPDVMSKRTPDSIIIMAAAYSDEILRVVLDRYSKIRKIAVLRENELEIIK